MRAIPLFLVCLLIAGPTRPAAASGGAELQIASVAAAVVDLSSGTALYQKHADVALPIASITKLMTALVVLESGADLQEWLTVVDWNRPIGKNAYSRLRIGSEAQRQTLLRIALMSSENLASHVLARHHPGGAKAFVAAMNRRAAALGMTSSRFVDAAGLSPRNRASAVDLARLVQAAYRHPLLRELSTGYQHVAHFRKPRYTLPYGNTNPLVASGRWTVDLTKTGYLDEAGRCLVMVARIDNRPMALVLLNSFGTRTPLGDAGRIRRWLRTGEGGRVAGAALAYEQRKVRELFQQDAAAPEGSSAGGNSAGGEPAGG